MALCTGLENGFENLGFIRLKKLKSFFLFLGEILSRSYLISYLNRYL